MTVGDMMRSVSLKMFVAGMFLVSLPALLIGCNRPFHLWEAHTTSTPRPPSLDVTSLAREQVVTLLPATYNHLQGYIPSVSQALTIACSEASPPIHVLSQYETVNKLNHHGLALEYAEKDPSFAASRILDPQRLKQVGATLGVRYLFQPGLAYVSEVMDDKFEVFGWHILRTRVNTLGLWLRLWDAQTGEFLWEAAGEATVAAELLDEASAVPFHETARKLWRQMIQEALLGGKARSRSFLKEELPLEP